MTNDQLVAGQARQLNDLLQNPSNNLSEAPEGPGFFIERAPYSPRGARCKLIGCTEQIKTGAYRVAVFPVRGEMSYYKPSANYYHVECFERIANLADFEHVNRFYPLWRGVAVQRNLSGLQIMDGEYFLDAGARRLLTEALRLRKKLLIARDGLQEKIEEDNEAWPAWKNLLFKAGLSQYRSQTIPGFNISAYFIWEHEFAPIESDGEDDQNEWNLFAEAGLLDESVRTLDDLPTLSHLLDWWETQRTLVHTATEELTPDEREIAATLSSKHVRAVKRLSGVYPQY